MAIWHPSASDVNKKASVASSDNNLIAEDRSLPAVADYPVESVPYDEVFRYLGMGAGTPDNALQEKVEQMAERALKLVRPRAALRVFRLQNTQPISLEGSRLKLTGSDIQQF